MPEKESTYQIMDLMPDFWEFHAKSRDANVSEQAALFKKMVVDKLIHRRWAIAWHFMLSGGGIILTLR